MKCLLIIMLTVCGHNPVRSEEFAALSVTVPVDSQDTPTQEASENIVSTADVFVPTKEWQEIKPGQAIPRGLHVRINMQTGEKEAKYLEEENEKKDDKNLELEDLKHALKGIKNDFKSKNTEDKASSFRSFDELKSDLKEFEMKVDSDYAIMLGLVDRFVSATVETEQAEVVLSLEYYVHQYDNAIDFVTLGGIAKILVPSLNSSLENLQESAGFLIGSAAQSNPRVQVAFLEAGFVDTLLRIIATKPSPAVTTKALYGLSAILRNFPEAQNTFLRNGGLDSLKLVFKLQGKPFDKIKIKILTLVQDLLDERRHLDVNSDDGRKRLEQYSKIDLENLLSNSGWCEVFQTILVLPREDRRAKRDDILSAVSEDFPLRVEHDSIEKILLAMQGMKEQCGAEYTLNESLRSKLSLLFEEYSNLSGREEDQGDQFFSGLKQTISSILNAHNVKTEL